MSGELTDIDELIGGKVTCQVTSEMLDELMGDFLSSTVEESTSTAEESHSVG